EAKERQLVEEKVKIENEKNLLLKTKIQAEESVIEEARKRAAHEAQALDKANATMLAEKKAAEAATIRAKVADEARLLAHAVAEAEATAAAIAYAKIQENEKKLTLTTGNAAAEKQAMEEIQ